VILNKRSCCPRFGVSRVFLGQSFGGQTKTDCYEDYLSNTTVDNFFQQLELFEKNENVTEICQDITQPKTGLIIGGVLIGTILVLGAIV